ncbi:MAG: TetR family transcriptional regulator [Ilumatobacter sp.]|uniref:TetR/AcrR family transcriptional regulator n=1 Tax=Ilumatobacter sp. TaxID=1967498 RepID=UPI002639499F|nr:TetR family transcriptional regulator [Ilumatobacter sp.]MDJ0767926.1 TetR family transcriptional regulator [Ilumatobacter sp.]
MTSAAKPLGRRPGDPDETRRTILAAARRVFAAEGFDRATIRRIAAEADVDPALVNHHFGGKRSLFAAAHEFPVDPGEVLRSVVDAPPDERGVHLAAAFLSMAAGAGSPVLSLLRAAATDADAATMLREFVADAFLSHADVLAPGPNGRRRLALAGSHLIGMVVARNLVGISALADEPIDDLVAEVGPVIQRYLDEPSTENGHGS